MAETDVDGSGAGEKTNSPASGTPVEGAAQLSGLVKSVVKEALAEELKPIKGDISGLYSRQDKDRNAFREFMDEFKRQKANGLSDADAESAAAETLDARAQQARKDKMLEEVYAKVVGPSSAQAPGKGASGADVTGQLIASLELDANDAGVLKIVAENPDPMTRAAKLGQYKANAGTRQPDPSAAPALQSQPAKQGDLMQEYEKTAAKLHGNALIEYKMQMRKRGLDIN